MGNNSSSDEAKGAGKDVIKQTEKSSHELYELVDLTNGGRLVHAFRKAKSTKDFSQVDEMIDGLKKFLYQNGEGKNVSVSDLIEKRRNTRISEIKKLEQAARSKWRGVRVHGMCGCCGKCWRHSGRQTRVHNSSTLSVSMEPLTMNGYIPDETAGKCWQFNFFYIK